MEKLKKYLFKNIFFMTCFVLITAIAFADDTCVFQVTADDIPPNIVILLDNGAEMEQVVWHSAYDNSIDYTPSVAEQRDVLETGLPTSGTLTLINITNSNFSDDDSISGASSGASAKVGASGWNSPELSYVNLSAGPFQVGEVVAETTGGVSDRGSGTIESITETGQSNGFFNDRGYGIIESASKYYLVDVPASLNLADHSYQLEANNSDTGNKKGTWTINGRNITLPAEPSTTAADGIIDNANSFRYSKNYLNWLFFSTGDGSYINASGVGDGTDLPNKSRFYYAKNAIITVAMGTLYKAKFGLYYFSNDVGGSQAQPLKFAVNANPDGVDNDSDGDTDEMDEILSSTFINNVNNMQTVTYSPLAEGLSTIGYYYSSPSSGASGGYCQQNFSLVISPGISSQDQGTPSQHVPAALSDYDADDSDGCIGEGKIIPTSTGMLFLDFDSVSGAFQDNEPLIDSASGAAAANGTLKYAIAYNGKTSDFTVGEVVTGESSGDTGTVLSVVSFQPTLSGTSGALEFSNVSGAFADGESLTGNSGGAAVADGPLYYTLHYDGKTADFTENELLTGGVSNNTGTIAAIILNDIPINLNGSTYLDDVAYYLYSNDIVGDDEGTGALRYDAKTTSFTVGEVVTGGTSGATGTITAVNEDAGDPSTTGSLEFSNIIGTFQDDEALTGSSGGDATVDGTLFQGGEGFQSVLTYTIGFMGDQEGNLFLINTSNNGNGNKNLYNTSDKEYGKYHFTAESPGALSTQLLAAVNDILSRTSTFTAPVVPVTKTTSGDRIYMAFFKPGTGNFWEGNVTKFGISSDNEIVDYQGDTATHPNGAIKDDAIPYWQTKDWATSMSYATRNIYTYLGTSVELVHSDNAFETDNNKLTAAILGSPTNGIANIINYVRGKDVFDEDGNSTYDENREVITGDVLHSEPVVFEYNYSDDSSKTLVFFGANDGMFHAVLDMEIDSEGDETSHGTEHWAFIPPDQLHRLKKMVEDSGHQYYVDSTPNIYFKDQDNDGLVDTGDGDQVVLVCGEREGGTSYFALDVTNPSAPKYLWRITNYQDNKFGTLTLTDISGTWHDDYVIAGIDPVTEDWTDMSVQAYGEPDGNVIHYDSKWYGPSWDGVSDLSTGDRVRGWLFSTNDWIDVYATIESISEAAPYNAGPTTVISELGETWSEPRFGLVKTSAEDDTGTPVLFIGGGYSSDNTAGKAVIAVNVLTGALVKKFTAGMTYSIPSTVTVIDADGNGFVDKLYVGDLGGQMWRIGRFTYTEDDPEGSYSADDPMPFPNCNEDINTWTTQTMFLTDAGHTRKFFYPPSITLEEGYDLVFMGTGDRENACSTTATNPDLIYCVKDTHSGDGPLVAEDLVDVTNEASTVPDLNDSDGDVDENSYTDEGWYIRLVDSSGNAVGEKVLSKGSAFYKVFYVTTFTPNDNACQPGGEGKLYALDYLTGAKVIDLDGDDSEERSITVGGGIPSTPVMVITDTGVKQFIAVGSTNPDENSQDVGAGILAFDPKFPSINFFYLWWNEF